MIKHEDDTYKQPLSLLSQNHARNAIEWQHFKAMSHQAIFSATRGAGATGAAAPPPPRPLLRGAAGAALPFSHSD